MFSYEGNYTLSNITIDDNSSKDLEKSEMEFDSTPFQALYVSIVIVLTIAGNTVLCLTIYLNENLRNVGNWFIISLAISDVLMALLEMTPHVVELFAEVDHKSFPALCYISQPFGALFGLASVFNLCAIAANRYYHVAAPMEYSIKMRPTRVWQLLGVIWTFSILIACIPLTWRSAEHLCKGSVFVAIDDPNFGAEVSIQTILWLCIIIMPSIVMFTAYYRIFAIAHDQVKRMAYLRRSLGLEEKVPLAREIKAAKVLAFVGFIFIISWLPFFIFLTMKKFGTIHLPRLLFLFALYLMYTNSCINPVLLIVLNKDIRKACRRMMLKLWQKINNS